VNLGNAELYQVEKTCYCPVVANLPTTFSFPQVGTYAFRLTVDPNQQYTECNESNNQLVRTVNVASLPDMRVLSQHIAPSLLNPSVGQAVSFNMTYQNIGFPNINDSINMKVYIDNQLFVTIPSLPGLFTNDNHTVPVPGSWSSNLPGIHIVRTVIDADHQIPETNESNNEATRAIIVGESANLYFKSFTTLNLNPALNSTINVRAKIGNNGDLACDADLQLFYVNNNLDTILFHSSHIAVANHDSVNLIIPWLVADDKTTIIGKIINSSILEYTYDDNNSSFKIGEMLVITTSTPACGLSATGSITANVIGGEPPYTYFWNTGFIGQTLSGLVNSYTVTVIDATGQTKTGSGNIMACPPATLQTKFFLQGYYISNGLMNPALYNQGQPALPTHADSVTIELHSPVNPTQVVESYKGIWSTNGYMESYFSPAVNGNTYYIVLKFRNGIETWSAQPILISSVCNYDFSTAASKAYGDNQIQMDTNNWAIYSGDISMDGNIDLLDISTIETDAIQFKFGYYATDLNGDGNVDLLDMPIVDQIISLFIYSIHP
jgi:hypothetical protein